MTSQAGLELHNLAPAERIYMARFRLQSTEVLFLELVRLGEQVRSLYVPSTLNRQLSSGPGERAFETLQQSVAAFHLIQVARLWDRLDLAGFSLPTLAELLAEPAVLEKLQTELEDSLAPSVGCENAPRDATLRVIDLDSAVTDVRKHTKSDGLKRLRQWRDRRLAHPIFRTRAERSGPIPDVSWDELKSLVQGAETALTSIARALNPLTKSIDWPYVRQETREQSDALFGKLRYEPQ